MRRISLLFILSTLFATLSAQKISYNLRLTDSYGKSVNDANLFIESGTTDQNGRLEVVAEHGKNTLIEADGYQTAGQKLYADPIYRVVLDKEGEKKSHDNEPQILKTEFEEPLYVVNGRYIPHFTPSSYSEEMITSVTTTKRWKDVKGIFAGHDIEGIDVTVRGVACVTTAPDVTLNTSESPFKYTIIVTDSSGNPIEGAVVYTKVENTSGSNLWKFELEAGKHITTTSAKYENKSLQLTAQPSQHITLIEKQATSSPPMVKVMPTFNGGGLKNFMGWLMNYTREELSKCRMSVDTSVYALFTVGASGKVVSVEILSHNNPRAATIVKNAIYRSPKWEPAIDEGKAVKLKFTIPVIIPGNNY